jgi:hypothetical protein
MDGTSRRQETPAPTVRRLRNPRIGFIGKVNLTAKEKGFLYHVGKCLAVMGHETVIIPGSPATDALREGVKAQGGRLAEIGQGVIEQADHTWIYADIPLLERIETKYTDLAQRDNVLIVNEDQLEEWVDAIHALMESMDIAIP